MRFLIMALVLLVAMPAAAQDIENLWIDGDPIECTEFNPEDGVYTVTCNPTEDVWLDLDAIGLERFHYKLTVTYKVLVAGHWDGYFASYTLGGPEGVDNPDDTWADLIPEKIWYFPKAHNNFRDLMVIVTHRDVGVDVELSSTSVLKGSFSD